jgi:hypothetical protein
MKDELGVGREWLLPFSNQVMKTYEYEMINMGLLETH